MWIESSSSMRPIRNFWNGRWNDLAARAKDVSGPNFYKPSEGKTPVRSDQSHWAHPSFVNPPCRLRTSLNQRICRTKTYVGVSEQRILNQSGKIRRFSFTRNIGVGDKNARNESSVFTANRNPRPRRKNTYTDEDVKTYDTISHKAACPFAKNSNNQRASTVTQQNKI